MVCIGGPESGADTDGKGTDMRINLASVLVDDQEKALRFYTDVLGFVKKHDIPVGEDRWLTVVSPQDPDGTELVLEPSSHPAVKPFKEALVADGIPYTSFAVDDVKAEYERLRGLGVRFTQEPVDMGPVTTAVLDDTCGNLIQIAHQAG
jgi:catechol 2,3-dioxygenase-like lactoylglutathione lyase family enzyme